MATTVDKAAARELELFMDNDSTVYFRSLEPVRKNQEKHLARGKWNFKQSIKGFQHAVDAGAKAYAKEYGSGTFSAATRRAVARSYAEEFAAQHGIPTANLVG